MSENNTEAHIFFRDHVQPAIQDWRADETAIHKAMLVATNLAHMADYFWHSFFEWFFPGIRNSIFERISRTIGNQQP